MSEFKDRVLDLAVERVSQEQALSTGINVAEAAIRASGQEKLSPEAKAELKRALTMVGIE